MIPKISKDNRGFDAPVVGQANDHLNRWPLARQIYNVAANGPADWSVRVGAYGEWGTGKTSVLEFVASMAEQDGHIVVWFDPWEFTDKAELWRAYILAVYERVESSLGNKNLGDAVRRKELLTKVGDVVGKVAGILNSSAGDLAKDGLDLVKKHLSSNAEELASLREILMGKRVFVLIDDLDRTAAELVPEILYALKEVMDIPGFSFVCGFDPVVVGKVLRASHRGFGDGLKFLEKIIDYPVWLPPASSEGLLKIALTDARKYCPFVPEWGIKDSMALLPQNPRAIRQFIRLLSLLGKQIQRHHETELRWPVILPSLVIRTRFPKLASALLMDLGFLRQIGMRNTMEPGSTEGKKVDKEIQEHITKAAQSIGFSLDEESKTVLHDGMRKICDQMNLWLDTNVEMISYLVSIAERPCAVTLKEFDAFMSKFETDPTLQHLGGWISSQAKAENHTDGEVARELAEHLLNRYYKSLREADTAFRPKTGSPHHDAAKVQIKLLAILLLEWNGAGGKVEWIPLKDIVERLSALGDSTGQANLELWPPTCSLLVKLVARYDDNIDPLMHVLTPLNTYLSSRFEGKIQRKVIKEMGDLVVKRFAKTLWQRFEKPSFVDEIRSGDRKYLYLGNLVFDVDGPFWKGEQKTMERVFSSAKAERVVQENAYDFLEWIEYILREQRGLDEGKKLVKFVSAPIVLPKIWAAATAVRFSGRYARRLQNLLEQLVGLGIKMKLPSWWNAALEELPPMIQPAPLEET